MNEENKTAGDPSQGNEHPTAGSTTGLGEVLADQPGTDSASTPAPTTTDPETTGTKLGPHQEQAGMRS